MEKNDTLEPQFKAKIIRQAQAMAKDRGGLKIGETVAHSDHKPAFVLKDIVGKMAIVDFPGNNEGPLTLPLKELFSPNDAMLIMLEEPTTIEINQFNGPASQN